MPADTTIHPFPDLRRYAESEATAIRSALWDVDPYTPGLPSHEIITEAVMTLLCDLTRPASRDAVVRLVGERVGWPAWEVAKVEHDWISLWGLHRKVGLPAPEPWGIVPPFATTLATIVRHLWPQE